MPMSMLCRYTVDSNNNSTAPSVAQSYWTGLSAVISSTLYGADSPILDEPSNPFITSSLVRSTDCAILIFATVVHPSQELTNMIWFVVGSFLPPYELVNLAEGIPTCWYGKAGQ